MSLDYAILGFLSEGERSGYDLKTRCLDAEASHFWTADQAQVYRTLDRLERDRLVASRHVHQERRPDRKVFRLTSAGRSLLEEWLLHPQTPPRRRDSLLMQLRFADAVPTDSLLAALELSRDTRQAELDTLRAQLSAHVRSTPHLTRRDSFVRLTYDAAIAQVRAAIDWLDDCIETLGAELVESPSGPTGQRQLFGSSQESGGGA